MFQEHVDWNQEVPESSEGSQNKAENLQGSARVSIASRHGGDQTAFGPPQDHHGLQACMRSRTPFADGTPSVAICS